MSDKIHFKNFYNPPKSLEYDRPERKKGPRLSWKSGESQPEWPLERKNKDPMRICYLCGHRIMVGASFYLEVLDDKPPDTTIADGADYERQAVHPACFDAWYFVCEDYADTHEFRRELGLEE